ncbi:MAG: phospholipase [Elusimicrobia bacterium]|nr:phospholipase [Elusimicrobiota bacterium]
MLENHSFDQMLGCFKSIYPQLEGVDPNAPGKNSDGKRVVFAQAPTTARQILIDPHHEVQHVSVQLANENGGFVLDLEDCYVGECTDDHRRYVMSYYPLDSLPGLHALGRDFTICDRWHASVPGPTWPNRFFALTGTSSGQVDMPDDGEHKADLKGYMEQDQVTLFDRLSEKQVPWKIYFSGLPQSVVLRHQRRPENISRYFAMEQFYSDVAGAESEFPAFSLIEPDFMGSGENDDHPPHDVMKAQKLIVDVYNAIRAQPDLWNSTLLVIFYDEHGGFYDHVPIPTAPPPDQHTKYPFDHLGVRVPALLVSPWVARQFCSTRFDHTSLLKYLIEKWGLGPLGNRTAAANSIGSLIQADWGKPRTDTAAHIEFPDNLLTPPDPSLAKAAAGWINGHHVALQLLAKELKEQAIDQGASGLSGTLHNIGQGFRGALAAIGLQDPGDVAKADFQFYHQTQVRQARVQLAAMIRNETLSQSTRHHAAISLGYLVGVPFGTSADPILAAKSWLDKSHG